MRITLVNDSTIHRAVVQILYTQPPTQAPGGLEVPEPQVAATIRIEPEEGAQFELSPGTMLRVEQGEPVSNPIVQPSGEPGVAVAAPSPTVSPTAAAIAAVVGVLRTTFPGITAEAESRDYGNIIEVALIQGDRHVPANGMGVMRVLADAFDCEVEHVDYSAQQLAEKGIYAVLRIKARDVRHKLQQAAQQSVAMTSGVDA